MLRHWRGAACAARGPGRLNIITRSVEVNSSKPCLAPVPLGQALVDWTLALATLEMKHLQDHHCNEASVQAMPDGDRASVWLVTEFVRLFHALHMRGKLKLLICITKAANEDGNDILAQFRDVFRKCNQIFYSTVRCGTPETQLRVLQAQCDVRCIGV